MTEIVRQTLSYNQMLDHPQQPKKLVTQQRKELAVAPDIFQLEVESLDPRLDYQPLSELNTQWMRLSTPTWSPRADKRIKSFLYNNVINDQPSKDVLALLKDLCLGTSLEGQSGSSRLDLKKKVIARMIQLAKRCEKLGFMKFVPNGNTKERPSLTTEFVNYWIHRHRFWGPGNSPTTPTSGRLASGFPTETNFKGGLETNRRASVNMSPQKIIKSVQFSDQSFKDKQTPLDASNVFKQVPKPIQCSPIRESSLNNNTTSLSSKRKRSLPTPTIRRLSTPESTSQAYPISRRPSTSSPLSKTIHKLPTPRLTNEPTRHRLSTSSPLSSTTKQRIQQNELSHKAQQSLQHQENPKVLDPPTMQPSPKAQDPLPSPIPSTPRSQPPASPKSTSVHPSKRTKSQPPDTKTMLMTEFFLLYSQAFDIPLDTIRELRIKLKHTQKRAPIERVVRKGDELSWMKIQRCLSRQHLFLRDGQVEDGLEVEIDHRTGSDLKDVEMGMECDGSG